eukprot:10896425-Alexandrium_andersonii.AAC.1
MGACVAGSRVATPSRASSRMPVSGCRRSHAGALCSVLAEWPVWAPCHTACPPHPHFRACHPLAPSGALHSVPSALRCWQGAPATQTSPPRRARKLTT